MPAYNFQARFADMVAKRIKRQTIRARRKDGRLPNIGDRFIGYTGMRTKKCRRLVESRVSDVKHIIIDPYGIVLDGRQLDDGEANSIALLDGFSHANEMIGWFIENHGKNFAGYLIRWL